ncbi:MAG: molecular chaperone DnaJ, partial [Gammaproteobacteria bacterium]
MHTRLLLVLLALAGIILLLRWFLNTPAGTIARYVRRSAAILAVGILLYLTATGRLHWLFALLGSLLPFARKIPGLLQFIPVLRRLASQFQSMGAGRNPAPGQQSQVETRLLRMMLDHDTGRMNGEVLEGPFRGRHLENLGLPELLVLLEYCRGEDKESTSLLEAYLDNTHGDTWHGENHNKHEQPGQSFREGSMDRREALEILGLQPDADKQEILEAHRRLMQKL